MARDNVTFIFRIDSAKAQQTLRQLEAQVRKLGGEAVKTKQNVVSLGTGIDNSGQRAAASAVNFQTATQGMLNLSTAAVQTFTSISNLDRANNRAKMSIIAVARAEDLLNNKTERLNQLRESGAASAAQLANMEREIATATADLTVKQEKQAIEQAAVNDIYMLFATNVANVTVSSMQTLAILDKSDILLKKGRVIGQKLLTLTTWKSVMATRAESAARRENMAGLMALPAVNNAAALSYKSLTFAQRTATMATRAGTMALNGLKIALGPIGLIFIGISAAMVAYESNLGGIKDTINDLLGITDDFEQNLINDREATEELTTATIDLHSAVGKPDSWESAVKAMQKYRQELKNIRDEQLLAKQADALIKQGLPQQIAGFSAGGKTAQQTGVLETIANLLDPRTYAPSAAAQLQPMIPPTAIDVIKQQGLQPDIEFKDIGGFKALQPLTVTRPTGEKVDIQDLIERLTTAELLAQSSEFRRRVYEQQQLQLKATKLAREGLIPSFTRAAEFDVAMGGEFLISDKPNKKYSDILGYEISDYEAGFLYSKAKRGGNISLTKEERQVVKLIDEERGVDRDLLRDYDKDLRKLSNREIVKKVYDVDLFKIADVVDTNEALRLGKFHKELRAFRDTTGGQTDALLELINQQIPAGRKTEKGLDILAKMNKLSGGLVAPGMEFGTGFFKSTGATAAFQIPEFGISAKRRRELDIKDANTNLLRFGGRLREGMTVWDEGAVIGGYSSPKAFSDAAKRKFYQSVDEMNLFMMSAFGAGIDQSRIRGRSSRRHQQKSVLDRGTSVKQTLSLAGLGYRTFNINSLPYRHSASQYQRYKRDWNEVIAFNQNQLAKANQINLLEQDYQVGGFIGSSLSLPSLQDAVAKQDALMKSIGLDRTEAFQIIDTEGRGREEIDDRIRFKDRMNSMSTGVSVL